MVIQMNNIFLELVIVKPWQKHKHTTILGLFSFLCFFTLKGSQVYNITVGKNSHL